MLGQAALESGWGRREIRSADGTTSHNLFGIKAGRNWTGPTVETLTTEFVNGTPRKVVEKFRAYASYADSFRDYAKLIGNTPRYAEAARSGGDANVFANRVQAAGYATDPNYAGKLARVIQQARQIQTTV
jgi:flagellar protein FlgJ